MKTTTLERLLRVKELAEAMGWSDQRIYRLVNHPDPARRLPHVRLGREVHFRLSDVQAWLESKVKRAEVTAAPVERQRKRTHEEECEFLGIPADHEFATH